MNNLTKNSPYQALLIVSFGGPEKMDDVMPFLERVLKGRNVPRQRLEEVAHHYTLFNGISPLNQQNRDLIAALQQVLETDGPNLPIYFGNRNWHPFLADTLQQMANNGIEKALAFFTTAYSSYSSCRQYWENITEAQAEVGPNAPKIDKLRMFYNHPGFIEPSIQNVQAALAQIPEKQRQNTHIAFTAHSIPNSMAQLCAYQLQLKETAQLIVNGLDNGFNHKMWDLVYQSRSGPPHQPWLEPDICDHLQTLKNKGVNAVVIAPIGFISDHLEVIYDLDTEAKTLCQELKMTMVRAATVGTHPTFIKMIQELILERFIPTTPKRYLGNNGPSHDLCPANCCLAK